MEIIRQIFNIKSRKLKEIENKLTNFYFENININEKSKYKVEFKNRKKDLDPKYFKDDNEVLLIKLIPSSKSIELLNNKELKKDLTVMKDVIGYIENKNNKISFYVNKLEVILG